MTKSDEINTLFKTENPENHTLSGHTSPLRPHMGVFPGGSHLTLYGEGYINELTGYMKNRKLWASQCQSHLQTTIEGAPGRTT